MCNIEFPDDQQHAALRSVINQPLSIISRPLAKERTAFPLAQGAEARRESRASAP